MIITTILIYYRVNKLFITEHYSTTLINGKKIYLTWPSAQDQEVDPFSVFNHLYLFSPLVLLELPNSLKDVRKLKRYC